MGERTIPFCVKRQVVRRPSRMNFARRFDLPNRPVYTLYIKYFVASCNFSSSSHPFRSTFLSYSLSRSYFFRSSFFFAIPRRYGKKAKRTAKKKKEKKEKINRPQEIEFGPCKLTRRVSQLRAAAGQRRRGKNGKRARRKWRCRSNATKPPSRFIRFLTHPWKYVLPFASVRLLPVIQLDIYSHTDPLHREIRCWIRWMKRELFSFSFFILRTAYLWTRIRFDYIDTSLAFPSKSAVNFIGRFARVGRYPEPKLYPRNEFRLRKRGGGEGLSQRREIQN